MTQDFIIIGGGIAGVSAAARLSHLGAVTLLEAEAHLAHHTSGRSAALFEPNYGLAPIVELSWASEAHLSSAHGGVLAPRGFMLVAGSDEAEAFERESAEFGLGEITMAEARTMVPVLHPEKVTRAAFGDRARDIDTDLLIQNFVREARAGGAAILTRARVTAIRREGGLWHVTAGPHEHSARMLVNAAGAWADEIAVLAGRRPIGFTPLRRSMARIPAPEAQNVARWPMIMGAGESWYAKPDAGALIVSPAEEDPSYPHDAWADDMVLAEGLARYEARVTAPVTRLLASWAGLRTFAPDRVLVIGPDRAEPSFFWLAGQGGYGFQTSAAASQHAADLIGGRPSALSTATRAALSPARFG